MQVNTKKVIGIGTPHGLPELFRVTVDGVSFWMALSDGHRVASPLILQDIVSELAPVVRIASEALNEPVQDSRVMVVGELREHLNIDPETPMIATPETVPILGRYGSYWSLG